MRIHRIKIQNFRGFEDAELVLDPKLTVLVGANNAGKTTILDALAAVVTYRRGQPPFLDTDFRAEAAGADVREAAPIVLSLRLVPDRGKEKFEPVELGQVKAQPADSSSKTDYVDLRLKASYSRDTDRIEGQLVLVNPEGEPIVDEDLAVFPFREQLPFRAFGAERDLRRGMGGRWSDWSLILNDVRPSPKILREVAEHFSRGSDALIDKTEDFKKIAEALRPAGEAVGLPGSNVKLSAAAQDPAELLQQVMVEMTLPNAPRGFSVERHGLGTQGALLFAVYRLQVERQQSQQPGASAILTVEEPEAHLHPTAQRAMASQIRELPGQVVVASHSPDFVAGVAGTVAVVRSVGGNSRIGEIETQNRLFSEHSRVVFARSAIITEGLETQLIPVFARALGLDLDGLGIELVNARGQGDLLPAWKFFGPPGLDIPIVLLGDADDEEKLKSFYSAAIGRKGRRSRRLAKLRAQNYYTCAAGECLEFELARIDDGKWIDQAFESEGGRSHEEWLKQAADNSLSKSWKKKLNAEKVEDLREEPVKARAYRLSTDKRMPSRVAQLMTNDGTDASLIPGRFREALQRAAQLATDMNPAKG